MSEYIHNTDCDNFDTSTFNYNMPKAHSSGSKVVNLLDNRSKRSLEIALPMLLTWGAQEVKNFDTGMPTGKHNMSLQFPSEDYKTPEATRALTSMKLIESAIKQGALIHSKQWFGKDWYNVSEDERKFNARLIDEKFNSMLKYPKKEKGGSELDFNRPPTLTVKIPQWDNVWKCEIYDECGRPLFIPGKTDSSVSPLQFLPSMTRVMCLLQCAGIWLGNGKASITWNLKQAVVQVQQKETVGTCFLTVTDSDKKAFSEPVLETMPEQEVKEENVTIVDDTDEEGEEEEEEEQYAADEPEEESVPEPEPEPVKQEVKPKKKIVRKKVV